MRARSLAVAVVASVAFAAPAQQRGLARAVLVAKGPPIDGTLRSPLWARCRPLVLGGVRLEHDRGLAGHSDADAVNLIVLSWRILAPVGVIPFCYQVY